MMCEAWPFLIGRTRTHDHRIVVLPGFMTGTGLAGVLRDGADGQPVPPGAARLRELRPAAQPPLTIVYRTFVPRADDFGLPGTATLTDEHGRPILLTEGLVLQEPAISARNCGLTDEVLSSVRSLVAPAYRAFWDEGASYQRQASAPFTLTHADAAVAQITLEEDPPWVQARLPGETVPAAPQYPAARSRSVVWTLVRVAIAALITVIALGVLSWVAYSLLATH